MRTLFTILFFGAAIAAACIKKNDIGDSSYVTLSYEQTQCADAWKTGINDSATLTNVVRYLDSMQLYVAGINLTSSDKNSGQVCTACACKTGKSINVTTLNSDSMVVRYGRVGFK
jgi:hypothetical protein